MNDISYMRHALALAARGLGQTWPNPSVGAVIVKEGRILGRGVTARGGRPHAETIALAQAGEGARGSTLYVTLEPCAHHGKTPPCAQGVIAAGIARVVMACIDPNPKVQHQGVRMVQEAGIAVTLGVCEEAARAQHEGFFSLIERGRPFVSVKLATSADGKIALANGQSQWITGEMARARGQLLRGAHDAILTGIGTVLADDPALTCRLPGREADSPVRVVLDSALRLPLSSKLVQTSREVPLWVIYDERLTGQTERLAMLEAAGVRCLPCPVKGGKIDITAALALLGREGITRLLVEAGGALSTAFLRAGAADRIYWFRAPMVIGGDGLAGIGELGYEALAQCAGWGLEKLEPLGADRLEVYTRK